MRKIFLVVLTATLLVQHAWAREQLVRGKVLEVFENVFVVGILDGIHKQKKVKIFRRDRDDTMEISPSKGDRIMVLQMEKPSGDFEFFVQDFQHTRGLAFFGILFLVVFVLVARENAVRALLTLALSFGVIFWWLLPAAEQSEFLFLKTLLACAGISLVTLLILLGFSRKSVGAILGTMAGVATAAGFTVLIGCFAKITGLGEENIRILLINFPDVDVRGIIFSGIVLSALGATMDTAVSVASTVCEVAKNSKKKFKKLFRSGMNVGCDILGSMINTLVFAFTGGAFAMLVLFSTANDLSLAEVLNYEFVAHDVMMALTGSFGLVATVPATALLAAFLESFPRKQKS